MLVYDLKDFIEAEDPADIAILCNVAFKAMFSVYRDLLAMQGHADPAEVHSINKQLIVTAIGRVREIQATLPDKLVAADGFDALTKYLRTTMLDAELNMQRSAGSSPTLRPSN